MLTGIGWLDLATLDRWKQGRLPSLVERIQTNPSRVSEAMRLFRDWATERGLLPSETDHVARTPARTPLRFRESGAPAIEHAYRTHWVSPDRPAKKRERLAEKANRPPELVVIEPLNRDWTCHRCAGSGGLLVTEPAGPACLACAGLAGLEFLPAGDAAVSRRAKQASRTYAVVVRWIDPALLVRCMDESTQAAAVSAQRAGLR